MYARIKENLRDKLIVKSLLYELEETLCKIYTKKTNVKSEKYKFHKLYQTVS